jgi:Zn-dependent protease
MMHVSLAGPLSNFLLALVLGFILKVLLIFPGPGAIGSSQILDPLVRMIAMGINISVYLGVFNLLPVHPLDGSHILEGLLPPKQAMVFSRMASYGWIILMVLLFSGIFRVLIDPPYRIIMGIISAIFGF